MNYTSIRKYKAGQTIYHISPYNGQITEGKIVSIEGDDIFLTWNKSGNTYRHEINEELFKHIVTCCS